MNIQFNRTFALPCIISGLVCMGCFTASTIPARPASGTTQRPGAAYSSFDSFKEMVNATDAVYQAAVRVTEPGTTDNPRFHGFFFYNCSPRDLSQFDPSGRYMVDMVISIEGREVQPDDKGEIGIIDLKNNHQWTQIGETTAWNWQQGCRLEWVPGSSTEIIWDDRSDDKKSFVSRIYNTKTKKTRTLPRPVYTLSPDGKTALTHDFERMKHGGTNFVGLDDVNGHVWAPENTGIYKMDVKTGKAEQIVSVRQMARLMFPAGLPADTAGGSMYIFREGYNPSGTRFIAFVKDVRINAAGQERTHTVGYSMTPDGKDIRYLYEEPSHHYWIDDENILDNVNAKAPGSDAVVRGYFHFKDDGSGKPAEMLWAASNGHDSFHPGGEWILTDTYNLEGFQYLYLYHIATKKFIVLGKFAFKVKGVQSKKDAGILRVDLHPRFSPDGNFVSFDANYEGLGRQIYMVDIRPVLKNPPGSGKN